MRKLIYGVGLNDSSYPIKIKTNNGKGWQCPIYTRWINMLARCYTKRNNYSEFYEGVTVHKEWLIFSNFRNWLLSQDWEQKEIDKDLLGNGKIYSSITCCLISKQTNNHIRKKKENGLPWGVRAIGKKVNKFKSECNSLQGEKIYLGCYDSQIEAHKKWQQYKAKVLVELALQETDQRVVLKLKQIAEKLLKDREEGIETKTLKNDC